ncbi:hypothetical protein Q0590_33680 [Rhodocytophaga aerolata]|uniref:Uncharacterized protein n=1 Tax=Rhodocytophaga aerolata TaxID=455078 RepID=A0ABT8RGP6_9BACT|nr:hypothetical protein [Rhodocytophaga aerolata]MDO1451274.1 hypothetical protein [Rhodocytophaga aerolata]
MTKRFLLYALFILLFNACKKDNSEEIILQRNYKVYASIYPQLKEVIILDSFIDNRNRWNWIDTSFKENVDTSPYSRRVLQPGEGLIMSGNGSLVELSISYDSLKLVKNFELETEVKFIKNRPNNNYDSTRAYLMFT